MAHSLLYIPDISGFTSFVQTTEVEHSQHVIAELLEILISSNKVGFELAEVEGDALFFFMENEVLSLEMLLAQTEAMFTAFYSHLKLLETNRICPCNACATAPNLKLKIIAHCGELQFITVQNRRKPFGSQVIEVHRLLKNSVQSDNYFLLSKTLREGIGLNPNYKSKLYNFAEGKDHYDGKSVEYSYSIINSEMLTLKPFAAAKKYHFVKEPNLSLRKEFHWSAETLLEYISNYKYRHQWTKGVDKVEYEESEVTRIGSEHRCVIKGSDLDFITITKEAEPGQLVYGEYTDSPPQVDEIFQFYIITPKTKQQCILDIEVYWNVKSQFKKLLLAILAKPSFKKKINEALQELEVVIKQNQDLN